jgi:hypothetical protein
MTILTVSILAAALLTLGLAKVAIDANRPKPVRVIANRRSRVSHFGALLVAMLIPAFGAAVAYYSA